METTLFLRDLARTSATLQATSGRSEITRLVSALMARASAAEIAPLTYLLAGRLGPDLPTLTLALGEGLAATAILSASGTAPDAGTVLLRQLGDLESAARELCAHGDGLIALLDLYREMVLLATEASSEHDARRTSRLAALLLRCDGESAELLVRLVSGKLRLGVGDTTLLDALSLAKSGGKGDRAALDTAYARSSDIGAVARHYFEHGPGALASFVITPGHPVRPMLAESIADADTLSAQMGEVYAEGKFDGLRVQVHKQGPYVRLFGRDLSDISALYPEIVAGVAQDVVVASLIFEGEIIALDEATGEFLPMPTPTQPGASALPGMSLHLRLMAFDILHLEGRDTTDIAYTERRDLLGRVIPAHSSLVQLVRSDQVAHASEVSALFEGYISEGLEGIICKRAESTYLAGTRSGNWVKLKRREKRLFADSIDGVVVGYYFARSNGAVQERIGSLLLAVYDSETDEYLSLAKVRLEDFSDGAEVSRLLLALHEDQHSSQVRSKLEAEQWVTPQVVIEINAEEITRSPVHTAGADEQGLGYSLRAPRLSRLRRDKNAAQTTTVAQVADMYQTQPKQQVVRKFPPV